MNRLIQLKGITPLFLIALALIYVAILPKAQGVIPPPDGGYPGFNTAEGQNALFSITTGVANTAVGWFSLRSNTDGSYNTGVGAGTLLFNVGDQTTGAGTQNTAIGAAALLSNTIGRRNTAIGSTALLNNTEGIFNTATGDGALFSNITGGGNTATGDGALFSNTANNNTANGHNALSNNTEGAQNTAVGGSALGRNNIGDENTAIGGAALFNNNTGNENTAIGSLALFNNNIGDENTAIGSTALFNNTGSFNTAVGFGALSNNTTGGLNVTLGAFAGGFVTTANNVICIGTDVDGENVSSSCYMGNIFGQTSASGAAVYVNSNHRLGTLTSSSRFKDNIKPMDRVSEALFALKPVTFHYKKEIDPAGMQQCGLVAEEVEKVNPDLVVRDKDGRAYSVRYDQVNAMMLNEFLKEHRKNEKQEATIARLQRQIEALSADLQQVRTQVEKSMVASNIARNNRHN